MGIYQCENCGCVENTALGWYHLRNTEDSPDTRALCSVCGPTHFKNGKRRTHLNGAWHDKFRREVFPLKTLVETKEGHLAVMMAEYKRLERKYLALCDLRERVLAEIVLILNHIEKKGSKRYTIEDLESWLKMILAGESVEEVELALKK